MIEEKPDCYDKCPNESGLNSEGELPPDPDACINCPYSPFQYDVEEGRDIWICKQRMKLDKKKEIKKK